MPVSIGTALNVTTESRLGLSVWIFRNDMKMYRGTDVYLHTFLTSASDGGLWVNIVSRSL